MVSGGANVYEHPARQDAVGHRTARRATDRRQVAHEKIRAFGGRFVGDDSPVPIAAKQTDAPLPEPPPDLPPEGKENNAAPGRVSTLIADAYVSPLVPKDVF